MRMYSRGVITRRRRRVIGAQTMCLINVSVYQEMFPGYADEFSYLASELFAVNTEAEVLEINRRVNDLGWDLLESGELLRWNGVSA